MILSSDFKFSDIFHFTCCEVCLCVYTHKHIYIHTYMCAYIQREAEREVGMDGWIWMCNMKITLNGTSEAKGD